MRTLTVGVIGEYDPTRNSHAATNAAISHAAQVLGIPTEVTWFGTEQFHDQVSDNLEPLDAVWCAPGSPYRSMNGALNAIRFARESGRPFFGTCGGFQHAAIEYARNVLGILDAGHGEYDPLTENPFVSALSCSLRGESISIKIDQSSRAFQIYGRDMVEEPHFCSFGLSSENQASLDAGGLKVMGVDERGEARIIEIPGHRYFVATLFVPQVNGSH